MAEEKVLVQYIDSALAAANGSRPFTMGLRLALEYESKGWAKILNKPLHANPSLSINPGESRDKPLVKMPEEENLISIGWVTADYIDATIRKVGKKLGYAVEQISPPLFTLNKLLTSKILIVESNLKGYKSDQLENLRCIQFQKKIPFIFRIVNYDNSQFFKQNLVNSRMNIFLSAQIFEYVSELHESIVGEWFIEGKNDYYAFWKHIEKGIKKTKKEYEGSTEKLQKALEQKEQEVDIYEEGRKQKKIDRGLI